MKENNQVKQYLLNKEQKSLLRFITCGSVDDGKSTLIGRLLYDTKLLFDDQLRALELDSKKFGTAGGNVDYALLMDGLDAEREQGITIDVAYRFFDTDKRKFIVADCPGHEQYTRNMATGASTADLAVVLVDASKGLLPQTRRHTYIASLMGINNIILAINKMDLVGYSQEVFDIISNEYIKLANEIGIKSVQAIPVSAIFGDNIITKSLNTKYYNGPTLIDYLENVKIYSIKNQIGFRLPVQFVSRPDSHFRGFMGTVAAGAIHIGDKIITLPSRKSSTISNIYSISGEAEVATNDETTTITLFDEIDISRGDMIVSEETKIPKITDRFTADIIWLADSEALSNRQYWIKVNCKTTLATINKINFSVDTGTQQKMSTKMLELNSIMECEIATNEPIVFEHYCINRKLGSFILIDKKTNSTVAAGMIKQELPSTNNIHWQDLTIDKSARAQMKEQKPRVLWFTGISGAGKSTVANIIEQKLFANGQHSYILDGDNIRHGLNKDLGFSDCDRVENIRRAAEVAKLMIDAGLVVLVSFISPFRDDRKLARELFEKGEFIEIFLNTPLKIAENRDPKGLYKKARLGEIKNFTGIDSPYETPENPELSFRTDQMSAEEIANIILSNL